MRETSFSSSSGTGTPEYKRVQQLFSQLVTAIEDDLIIISGHLMSRGMITQENYQDFANWSKPAYTRAASLVQTVLNRVKLDKGYYYDFIQVLEKNKEYYNSILRKMYMYSYDVGLQRRPLSSESQYQSSEESQSEEESSALLRVPYVQYEDETSPTYKQGQVKSRQHYPSVEDEDHFKHFKPNRLHYCCFAIVDFILCGMIFLIIYWLSHDLFPFYAIFLFAIAFAQIVLVQIMVSMMCNVKSVTIRWHLFVNLGIPLLIGVLCFIILFSFLFLHIVN